MTEPPTVPGRDLNPGPLRLEESAFLTELMRPDDIRKYDQQTIELSK